MRRLLALAAALAALLGLAGCGAGAGQGGEDVQLVVTRDFGRETLGQIPASRTAGTETVMRYLQRNFKVTTRYGGGFVQSIDGLAGGREGTRPVDWFFYVNGVQAEEGAAATQLNGGDRVWWDRHDWGATMDVPAVVGSYPAPFVNGYGGKRRPVRVECPKRGDKAPCEAIQRRLADAGVIAAPSLVGTEGGDESLRVVVGTWQEVGDDRAARQVADGPAASGVYVKVHDGGRRLSALDVRGRVARTLGPGSGLIAATRYLEQPPTWFVTGTDPAGVRAAVEAFEAGSLANRFAVAVSGGRALALPVEGGAR